MLTKPGVRTQPLPSTTRPADRRLAGAGPGPTGAIRLPSTTTCPSGARCRRRRFDVTTAQPLDERVHARSAAQPDGVEDVLVAGAAAEVAGQRLAHLASSGSGTRASRSCTATTRPGRAEAALHGAGVDERLLHRVERLAVRQPLDGDHVAALRLAGRDEARAHGDAVEVDRAGPALALLAGVLGAGQPEPLAQDVEQALARPHVVGLAAARR